MTCRAPLLVTLGAAFAWTCACTTPLPPFGETVVFVDTDLYIPEQANRLRIDVFTEDSRWVASRDLLLPRPSDWPVSFSVYNENSEKPGVAYVRLRAYREGFLRDYLGERFSDGTEFVEPKVATTVDELCQNAPPLALGSAATLRRDRFPLTDLTADDCADYPTRAGSVAVYVDIPTQGKYRFGLLGATPLGAGFEDKPLVSLEVRGACGDPSTGIACDVGFNIDTFQVGATLDVDLQPGRVFLVTGSPGKWQSPSDITLAAALSDAWNLTTLTPAAPADLPIEPQLTANGVSTPLDEPEPATTVDRLLRVEILAGEVKRVQATLRGACFGTMARFSAVPPYQALVPAEAESCVDTPNLREPVVALPLGAADASTEPSEVGSFDVDDPCDVAAEGDRVCVPGGFATLGERAEQSSQGATAPPRATAIHHFWMDRFEVTVGAFRSAVAEGLALLPIDLPRENNKPLNFPEGNLAQCTYSNNPLPGKYNREAYPITCVNWYAARAFCQFRGGDLPTEAQWEYASRWAGRPGPTRYPWGDDPPQCACDGTIEPCHNPVFSSAYNDGVDVGIDHYKCAVADGQIDLAKVGPRPADVLVGPNTDATALGIVNMAGNVAEWTADSFHPFGSACWRKAAFSDPLCWEEAAPSRTVRGGSYESTAYSLSTTFRGATMPARLEERIGFRCAYLAAGNP